MLRTLFLAVTAFAILTSSVKGQLLNFAFSQTVSGGTIKGEIEGLNASGTSTPTEIVITSQPAGFPDAAPINLIASGFTFYNTDNNFTVSGGVITGADVAIYNTVAGGDIQAYLFDFTNATLGVSNENGAVLATNTLSIILNNTNTSGFAGTSYTPVPEPRKTTMIFLLAGVALLVGRKLYGRFSKQRCAVSI